MMFADLVDLEDLSNSLRELGIEVSNEATATVIGEVTSSWLNSATEDQKVDFQTLLAQLADKIAEGHVLPDAVEVISLLRTL
jgi:Ca2+-binding EF-hand superfamily protein